MLTYESEVTIDRPPDVVFPYLIDPAKQALWSGVPMRQITPGEMHTGSRLEVSFGKGLMKAKIGLEMISVDQGKRLAWKSFSGPIKWEGEYLLVPTDGGGTKLSQHGTLTFTGLWRFAEPMAGAEIKSGEVKELEKLKTVIEAA